MKAPTVAAGPISPYALSLELTQVVARVCKCEGAWVEHPGPLTYDELGAISMELIALFHGLARAAEMNGDAS